MEQTKRQFAIHLTVIRVHLGNEKFLKHCLVRLMEHQQDDEQDTEQTLHQNGEGFNKSDAVYLTRCAKHVDNLHPYELSEIRQRLYKYVRQLGRIMTEDEVADLVMGQ